MTDQHLEINFWSRQLPIARGCHPEVFLRKGVMKICSKFTGEHPCRSVISIKLLCNFIEIALRHGCSSVNLLHIFRTPFPRNTSERLLLDSRKLFSVIWILTVSPEIKNCDFYKGYVVPCSLTIIPCSMDTDFCL